MHNSKEGYAKQNRQQEALDRIREMILEGEMKPGVLHSESELAQKLGMSRTPVRSALAILSREAIVESIPQVGIRVRIITHEEMDEVFALRSALEVLVVEELVRKVKSNEVSLKNLYDNLTATMNAAQQDNKREYLEISTEFHYIIARSAGFHQAVQLLQTLRNKLKVLAIAAFGIPEVSDYAHMQKVIAEHTEIVKTIASGDERTARDLILRHLKATEDRLDRAARAM